MAHTYIQTGKQTITFPAYWAAACGRTKCWGEHLVVQGYNYDSCPEICRPTLETAINMRGRKIWTLSCSSIVESERRSKLKMLLKGLGFCLVLATCLAAGQAAVVRTKETVTPSVASIDATTTDSSISEAAVDTTTREAPPLLVKVALERNEGPSIPTTLGNVAPEPKTQQRSAKLLLLSTPPKRTYEVEQQLEEQEEENVNTVGSATTTAASSTDDETTEPTTTEISSDKITKLVAINESALAPLPAADNSTVSIDERPQEAPANNVAITVGLVEPEAEYVLFDGADVVEETYEGPQLSSFTHIGSDEHLQPVVHSVEIVPTSFNDPLLINYVHHFP